VGTPRLVTNLSLDISFTINVPRPHEMNEPLHWNQEFETGFNHPSYRKKKNGQKAEKPGKGLKANNNSKAET
jgi:hypothetical protein